jgi:holo-[acyl-carrier protein] synthase
VGLDLVDVADVERSVRGEHGEHYLRRIYTEAEVDACRGPSGRVEPDRLAARFAAKEAAIKALPGAGEEVRLTQIEVCRDASGAPTLKLSGRAAELFSALGATEIAVSLTHERDFAAATVVIT